MAGFLRQATASQSRALGPFISDSDFKTPQTGLTIANTDVKLVVNGGASANKNSGGGTHRVNGVYGFTFDATDTATVGEMEVSVLVSGALVVFDKFTVVEEVVYDRDYAASAIGYVDGATVNTTKLNGTSQTARDIGASVLLSSGTGTGQLSFTSGVVQSDAAKINGVATSSVTTISANVGTTQPVNFTGTAGSALVKTDVVDMAGAAVSTASAQIGVNVVSYASGQAPLQPTVAGRTLDVSAGGEAGLDWANIGSPTTTNNLSGTTVKAVTDAVGANVTSINSVSTSSVTTVNANIGTTQPTNFTGTGASALVKSDIVDIAGSAVSTSAAQIGVNVVNAGGTAWASGAITAASIASDAITAAKIAADAIGSSELAASAVTKIWDEQVDGTVTARQSLRLNNSAQGAIVAGAATTNVTIRDLADTKNRVDATVDANGNRTAVTLDLT